MLKLNKTFWLVACLLVTVLTLSGQVNLKDQPAKGEWQFSPEKIWEADKAGNTDFGRIAELLVTDRNNIIVRDFERNISYIFDDQGRFVKQFAPQGSGKGQLSFYMNRFQAGDKIVLAAPDKLHYFAQDGAFVRAVDNNLFFRFPLRFLNENEFLHAPSFPQSSTHQKKLAAVDLSTGQEKTLLDFTEQAARGQNPPPTPMVIIFSLIPQVMLDDDGQALFFGRSDEYTINTANHSGNIQGSFGLERQKLTASPESKRNHLADSQMPRENLERILSRLPDKMTHFNRIQSVNGLIYIFAVTNLDKETAVQPIDIFSPKGEYLYRANLKFGDLVKFGSPHNVFIKSDTVYVILKNEKGKQTLA